MSQIKYFTSVLDGNCEKYLISSFSNRFGRISTTLRFSASTIMLLYFSPPELPLNSSIERTSGSLAGLKATYLKYRAAVAPETLYCAPIFEAGTSS